MGGTEGGGGLKLSDLYLLAYNGACCVGWAGVLLQSLYGLLSGTTTLSQLYPSSRSLALWLTLAQSAAVLEIVHAALGLVRSPVSVTFLQVSSRIVALYAIVNSPQAQEQWGAALMILSWSLVEVPRYAFYFMALVTGDATKKTPYVLFWLRYSLFAVLYPSGILGEMTVFWKAAADETGFLENHPSMLAPLFQFFYGTALTIIYAVGSPFMIWNMVGNRKKAFQKRFAKPPPPPVGLCWPVDPQTGERSSTKVNQAILAAAVGAVNPKKAQAILQCGSKKWRFQYWKHLQGLVEEQCQSETACYQIAQAGLQKAYELFEFIDPVTKKSQSFQQAMAMDNNKNKSSSSSSNAPFHTMTITSTNTKIPKVTECQVPYKGQTLSGPKLKQQVQQWVDYGTIEPSAGAAIINCIDHPEYISQTIAKQCFVLLGAGSAMGPLLVLLSLGATVVAIDLDRPAIWKRLIGLVQNQAPAGTKLIFPVNVPVDQLKTDDDICNHAGCNLFTHTPRIRDWLLTVQPEQDMTVGSYAYLNGALHVQVSLAMDSICRDLIQYRRSNVSLAYLCTPTDLHLIPAEAHEAAQVNNKEYQQRLFCQVFQMMNPKKFLRKNVLPPIQTTANNDSLYMVNGVSVAQGPNYILAKRLQHWRAILAHGGQPDHIAATTTTTSNNKNNKGVIVSSNIAPSTSTASVTQNRTFAWAYEGMPYFRPYEIFAPETSNAVMSAILLSDLNTRKPYQQEKQQQGQNNNNKSSTSSSSVTMINPNQLFSTGAFHGGTWRCAYTIDSIGEASVFLYFSRLAGQYLQDYAPALAGAAAAVVGSTYYYYTSNP